MNKDLLKVVMVKSILNVNSNQKFILEKKVKSTDQQMPSLQIKWPF